MITFKIQLELLNRTYIDDISNICKKHNCQVSVFQKADTVICDITTDDPVNFFMLGRRWIQFDNIIKVI